MKTVLITGCSRGIGRALASEFLAHGWAVAATARRTEDLAGLAGAETFALDVTDPTSIAAAREALPWDHLDVLVNNAAVFPGTGDEAFPDLDPEWFAETFACNVGGPVRVLQAFLPLLRGAPRGTVINISSGAGSISDKTDSLYYPYAVSKAALNMLTRALAAEFSTLTITALSPGWVRTEMGGENAPLTPEESAASLYRTITGLEPADSGKFLGRDGETYPW
jgi:NAD(P)-dependent dehydrogenase (short-subunit alcohol dehydrogenase family)